MLFAATWMDPEITILSKSERERQVPYDITQRWHLKHDTNELIYKTETDAQTKRTDFWFDLWPQKGQPWGKTS